jgi:hypothetical protein
MTLTLVRSFGTLRKCQWVYALGKLLIVGTLKKGPPLGTGDPRRRVPLPVSFSHQRGVIHPSFPLRGRWERDVKSVKQAPSPSLAALYLPVM